MAESTYTVDGLIGSPNLFYIHDKVKHGNMTNKNILGCSFSWDDEEKTTGTLDVTFDGDLGGGDDALLAQIGSDAVGKIKTLKTRSKIMAEILESAEQTEQLPRLLDALDAYPSMPVALDNHNYQLAINRVGKALNDGVITQDDYDLIIGSIPSDNYV